jgi:hypothetical protein
MVASILDRPGGYHANIVLFRGAEGSGGEWRGVGRAGKRKENASGAEAFLRADVKAARL